MEQVWALGHDVAGLPRREMLALPPKPDDIDTNEETRKDWRKAAAKVYADNVRLLSKRMQFDQGEDGPPVRRRARNLHAPPVRLSGPHVRAVPLPVLPGTGLDEGPAPVRRGQAHRR